MILRILKLNCLFLFIGLTHAQKSISDYEIFEDSTKVFKSVDDIFQLDRFQDKVLFVDIWGTRCAPCIKEFAYGKELKNKFKDKEVEFIYLCSPYKMERDEKNIDLWKELIVKHDLDGFNVFMSPQCYMDGFFEKYSDEYTEMEKYAIPAYLLVDKNGVITNFKAPRPSTKTELYDQIEDLLAKK